MARKRSENAEQGKSDAPGLRHVLVVGGTVREWDDLGEQRWVARRHDLAKVVANAGAMWLTLRPYERGAGVTAPASQRMIEIHDGCTVVVDPAPDGHDRFLAAIEQLRDTAVSVVDESALSSVLMAPAPVEPDLTVILGPSTQLPPSLVWELSYSEIVFIDIVWDHLSGEQVERAINAYAQRHRRFGGIE